MERVRGLKWCGKGGEGECVRVNGSERWNGGRYMSIDCKGSVIGRVVGVLIAYGSSCPFSPSTTPGSSADLWSPGISTGQVNVKTITKLSDKSWEVNGWVGGWYGEV